jgi:hypothetical protein
MQICVLASGIGAEADAERFLPTRQACSGSGVSRLYNRSAD